MSRNERRNAQREAEKNKTVYTLTPKQIQEMRENAYNEAKDLLTKKYDRKFEEYVKQYEERIKDVMQVSVNRALIYVLGLGVEILTKKFGFTKKQNHKWFDEVRLLFNESPDLLSQLVAIEQFSGWDLTPTLEELGL